MFGSEDENTPNYSAYPAGYSLGYNGFWSLGNGRGSQLLIDKSLLEIAWK